MRNPTDIPNKIQILCRMHGARTFTPQEACSGLKVNNPSNMLSQMEADGLVEQTSKPAELRARVFKLSKAGKMAARKLKAQMRKLAA